MGGFSFPGSLRRAFFIALLEPMTTHNETAAIAENEKRIEVHEAVCAERYQGILDRFVRGDRRMQRIEYILYFLMLMALVGRDGAFKLVELFVK